MTDIDFLNLQDVLLAHEDQTRRYGGDPSVRDMGLLESAIAQPPATFGNVFLHDFPFGMAAAYLYHIVQNHPFVDGNKRTGAVAALLFLDLEPCCNQRTIGLNIRTHNRCGLGTRWQTCDC